jgi:hypothetical protein
LELQDVAGPSIQHLVASCKWSCRRGKLIGTIPHHLTSLPLFSLPAVNLPIFSNLFSTYLSARIENLSPSGELYLRVESQPSSSDALSTGCSALDPRSTLHQFHHWPSCVFTTQIPFTMDNRPGRVGRCLRKGSRLCEPADFIGEGQLDNRNWVSALVRLLIALGP